jgi:hypothetical protein
MKSQAQEVVLTLDHTRPDLLINRQAEEVVFALRDTTVLMDSLRTNTD